MKIKKYFISDKCNQPKHIIAPLITELKNVHIPVDWEDFFIFGVNEWGKFDFVGVICTIRSTLRMILVMEYATMVQVHR
jgi:hypothetical protein